ncbi:MAG TPA: glycosyltransferase family 9 protein, partial [Candidatus Binatus sp.]|nr:glycosyltransferase family 9 protein [Candidatus Binatus sp.]
MAVDLFARSEFAEIVPPRVIARSLERFEISRLFVVGADSDDQLHEFYGEYHSVFSWLGSQQSTFGDNLNRVSNGRSKIFPFRSDSSMQHQSDYYLHCLEVVDVEGRNPQVALRPDAERWRDNFWSANSLQHHPILTMAPGSGAREKNWPQVQFLEIAQWWRKTTGGRVIVLMGPVEAERGGFDLLQVDCLTVSDLSLAQVAALLAWSIVYVGNDSGISHLAAAIGIPSVVLFGPGDPRQ